jgi:hypothetical protein
MRLIGYSRFDSWADYQGQNEGDIDFNLSTGTFIITEDEEQRENSIKCQSTYLVGGISFSVDSEKMNELLNLYRKQKIPLPILSQQKINRETYLSFS